MALLSVKYEKSSQSLALVGDADDILALPVRGGTVAKPVAGWDGHTWLAQVRAVKDDTGAPIAEWVVATDTSTATGPNLLLTLDTAPLTVGVTYYWDLEATDTRDTKLRGTVKVTQDVSRT